MKYVLNLPDKAITILGGGVFSNKDLNYCVKQSGALVSADGGANTLIGKAVVPNYIIGDLDSLKRKEVWQEKGVKLVEIVEQDTTDFEKCIYSCNASLYLCIGFVGKRVDHFLSVCSTIIKYYSKRLIIIGSHDIIFHIPRSIKLVLPLGTRVSLFPMDSLKGVKSTGLYWPISGLEFSPSNRIGTSNKTNERNVSIEVSDQGMLMILPKSCLEKVIQQFLSSDKAMN